MLKETTLHAAFAVAVKQAVRRRDTAAAGLCGNLVVDAGVASIADLLR